MSLLDRVLPRADLVRAALEKCPLVIAADAWPTGQNANAIPPSFSFGFQCKLLYRARF